MKELSEDVKSMVRLASASDGFLVRKNYIPAMRQHKREANVSLFEARDAVMDYLKSYLDSQLEKE